MLTVLLYPLYNVPVGVELTSTEASVVDRAFNITLRLHGNARKVQNHGTRSGVGMFLVEDQLQYDKWLSSLTVAEVYTREAMAMNAGQSLKGVLCSPFSSYMHSVIADYQFQISRGTKNAIGQNSTDLQLQRKEVSVADLLST